MSKDCRESLQVMRSTSAVNQRFAKQLRQACRMMRDMVYDREMITRVDYQGDSVIETCLSRMKHESYNQDPAVNAMLDVLFPLDVYGAPDFIFCDEALPHRDWNSRFFSIVLGTMHSEDDAKTGYRFGFSDRAEPFIDESDPTNAQLKAYMKESHVSVDLFPGDILSFNPGSTSHWAQPIAPCKRHKLLLLQWDMIEDFDRDAREHFGYLMGCEFETIDYAK